MFRFLADLITFDLLHLQRGSHAGESVNFFIYDVPKIYFMLLSIVFVVAVIRSFLPPEKIRSILGRKNEFVGNILAACFGTFTPFCTCSAIPLFMGMLQSGVPLGVTMSFLVAAPTINEVALVLLWGLFGWRVAVTYIISGLLVAISAGFIIGRLKMERFVEDFVTQGGCACGEPGRSTSWKDRFEYALEYTKDIFSQVWLFILLGIGLGALIHGYVPVDIVLRYASKDNPFAVIIAVLIGVPIYANCAGAIPVVQAILEKGLPLGTSLAFMMSVTGLSLPEFIILRKVLKPRLLITFFGTVALGIILIGYFFNLIF
jgi:uncharacterized protein